MESIFSFSYLIWTKIHEGTLQFTFVLVEEKYKSIDYQNVTLSLDSYFLYNEVKFVQETTFQNSSLKTLHKENFNGIYDGDFGKCFELQFHNKPDRHLREIKIIYDYQRLYADLEPEESLDMWLFTHHPGQFLLATQDPTSADTTYNIHYVWINDLEILLPSPSIHIPCLIRYVRND